MTRTMNTGWRHEGTTMSSPAAALCALKSEKSYAQALAIPANFDRGQEPGP